ncbi:helix-turn-helix domain-containing protein [Amycolatopsis sp. CB00013]|uniref:helix-turn-helix domain-containing protein n=1 Tax=Amycolatopsis sp. CB00013 TaxID=1703945 RepID=UPI000939682D|nr:helix-turn-helix transcriptional regulator [Amycolatopsis sp. CB00013]
MFSQVIATFLCHNAFDGTCLGRRPTCPHVQHGIRHNTPEQELVKSKKRPQLSTAKQRELGAELRRIRTRAGYLATDMSRMLGWPASTISRLESGLRTYQAGDIAIYLARAKATPRELNNLVALDRRPDDGYQVRSHRAGFPDDLPLIALLDNGSQSITTYNPVSIPRQLQIEPYIREVLVASGYHEGPILDALVHTRLARQSICSRMSGQFTFYLHEAALLEHSASRSVLHEQLLHLLIISSVPYHRIHVLPANADITAKHIGFTVYLHDQHRPVVHHQQFTTSLFLENDDDTAYYRSQLQRVAQQALTCQETQYWLAEQVSKIVP